MESFAQIFVSAIAFINALVPQAQVPQVLGVRIADESISTTEVLQIDNEKSTRLEYLDEAKKKRLEAKKQWQEKQELVKKTRESNKQDLSRKLSDFSDTRKIELAEKLTNQMTLINTKWTSHWSEVLDKLISILARIQSRLDKLEEKGMDVSKAQEAVTVAQVDIETARNAVIDQAAKVYPVQVTDEERLGESLSQQKEIMRSDLVEVKKLVSDARMSAREALSILKQITSNEEN